MSRLDDKDRAARRRKKDKSVAKARAKVAKSFGIGGVDSNNRFTKKHPLDCGRANCGVCHGYKRYKEEKLVEKREKQKDKFDN